jgi:acyl-CoA synthetase (AMP-forming)/AMP-acid ligase II
VLLVRPGIDFISLVFALFKAGVVTILVDPGLGKSNMLRCLEEARPDGFIAIPLAQAIRRLFRHRFPQARIDVTVGRRWFWGGPTLDLVRANPTPDYQPAVTTADDPAAIIFTTGSTGPAKGVLYRHGNFARQVDEIRSAYGIQPGEVDLPGFPLFALFNAAMGVTTVVPDMDFSRRPGTGRSLKRLVHRRYGTRWEDTASRPTRRCQRCGGCYPPALPCLPTCSAA